VDHTSGYVLQQVLNATQLASFYLPLALAFAIVQAITRRIFLAFGDLAMFASFAAVYVCFDSMLQGYAEPWSAALSLAGAMACGAALGIATARLFLGGTLLTQPLAYMIASIGLAIALQEGMRLQSQSKDIWVPPLFSRQYVFELGGDFPVRLAVMPTVAVLVSLLVITAVIVLLGVSRFGLLWRATSQSVTLAALCGVNALQVAASSFAIAGALAGVTGWTSAISYGGANFSVGLMVGFKAMFASVIGGFGSLRGAALGAMVLAVIEVAWSATFSTAYRDVAVFAFIIAVLVLRPEGLLATFHQRESEDRP
jgi:branched-chain amino acid transport system permease protein